MGLKFKPYHPKQAKQRRSTLAPTSTTSVGSLPPLSSVAGHRCSHIDEKFIAVTITNRDENPYFDFPTTEEWLDYCLPTSENPVTGAESTIDPQHTSRDLSCHGYRYKDDEPRQRLPAAIATMPLTSELNIEREAYNINTSEEESNTEISSADHTWSPDTKTTPSMASSISTPLATSPHYQKQICRNQDAFVNNNDSMQNTSLQIADFNVSNTISYATLSGENHTLRAVAAAANSMLAGATESSITTEPGITIEPSSVISSSIKRSFSEGGASLSSSDVCHLSKRLKLTSASVEKAISALLDAQKTTTIIGVKLYQDQPHSLKPDVSVQSMSDTIHVAADGVGDDSGDDRSNTGSSFDDSDSETELTISQPQGSQQRSTQRRRWTEKEEKLLRAFKGTQKRTGGTPSDYQIANSLNRTESGVKQYWDIMLQKKHR
ncbi:hypothetical protein NOF04DRAFT_21574 [Fusarium oxysporum II5]|uniref:Myb-like domain-containing protein n=1 Tax=Fusarium odoratissimum (strain NRRL 54006) TaxID=1089451 RepID=X0IMW3_FUSO5|nr:uncharacterized protein FOIG_16494 [Fusarium odoratissimum NRRL 54006]EXL90253.1 hypothetical protein FOIG_16494 [Fusarium odoratissimum NRRL 54006]KAK2134244.1 hypothetical protein NOF04DRAFT_21574 [Fusarium oxysporum II5]